jgi:hypothetical protein
MANADSKTLNILKSTSEFTLREVIEDLLAEKLAYDEIAKHGGKLLSECPPTVESSITSEVLNKVEAVHQRCIAYSEKQRAIDNEYLFNLLNILLSENMELTEENRSLKKKLDEAVLELIKDKMRPNLRPANSSSVMTVIPPGRTF